MKGTKILVGLLSASAVIGAMSLAALADEAPVIVTNTDELTAALNDSSVTEIIVSGRVEVGGANFEKANGITIKGDTSDEVEDALVFDANQYKTNTVTFFDLTLEWQNANYCGFIHATDLAYNNCTVKGQPFLYGVNETFNDCNFIQESPDSYNLWTYGAKNATFNNCTFTCAGRGVLVYNEGAASAATVNFNGCTFTATSSVAGKAAIEIDSSLISGSYTINIDTDSSVANETEANGFASGSNSGNSLYNAKKFQVVKDTDDSLKLNSEVTLKDTTVAPVSDEVKKAALEEKTVATVGDKAFDSLVSAFNAAKTGDTVTLFKDTTVSDTINIKGAVRKGITFDGNGKTLTVDNCGGIWFDNYSDFVIKDLTVEGTATYGITLNGGKNKLLKNVKMSGTYVFPFMNLNTGGATLEDCDLQNTETGEVYGGFLASSVWANVDSAYGEDMLKLVNSKVDGITINEYGTKNYLMPKILVDENSKTAIYTYDDGSLSKTRLMCVSPESKGLYTVKQVLTDASDNITGISDSITPVAVTDTSLSDTKGNTKNFSVYFETVEDAAAAAKAGDKVTLISDVTTDKQIVFAENAALDLNGHILTSYFDMGSKAAYAVIFKNGGTLTDTAADGAKGELVVNKARAVSANNAMFYVKDTAIRVTDEFKPNGGQAVLGTTGGLTMENSSIIGEFEGSYGVCSFGKGTGDAKEIYVIKDSVITVTDLGFYRNGSSGEFEASVSNTDITATAATQAQAVYISNNKDNANNHKVKFDGCTIVGPNGVEVKFTDLTLNNCKITATDTPSYIPNNNGGTAGGFAAVLSDNSSPSKGETIQPRGSITITGNGEYVGLIALESLEDAKDVMGGNTTDVKIYGGTFSTDVSDYCADGFSAKLVGGKYVVDETANKITLKFVSAADKVYDIVLNGNGQDINRLNTADFTFAVDNTAVSYTIASAEGIALVPVIGDENRYEFHFNGKTGTDTDTGSEIKIGTVTFTGYGKFVFNVVADAETNLVTATSKGDNLVTEFVTAASASQGTLVLDAEIDTEFTVPTKKLTVNITFPNAVTDNETGYQDMTVTIAGGETNETFKLGIDGEAMENGAYKITKDLTENTPYTVTVSGAGYRTARYTVTLNSDKTLNFWNNVKDNAVAVEEGNTNSAKNVTFLAGDIVKDNVINIYDLSAVVSYFGESGLSVSNKPEYAKYDLNRDGKIDSKDVAYVLVSWGK